MKKILLAIAIMACCTALGAQESVPDGTASVAMPFSRITRSVSGLAMGGVSNLDAAVVLPKEDYSFKAEASYMMWGSDRNAANIDLGLLLHKRFAIKIDASYDMGPECSGFKTSDMMAGVGLGYVLNDFLSVGVKGRYLSSQLAKSTSLSALCGDIMLGASFGSLQASLGVRELGTKLSGYGLPASAAVGVGYAGSFGKHGVEAKADFDYYFCGAASASVGAAYCWNDMLSLRAGYHAGGVVADFLSLGAGASFKGISLNLSYLTSQTLGGSLLLGLACRF